MKEKNIESRMSDAARAQKITKRFWDALDQTDRELLFCLTHIPSPVSLETLVQLSGGSILRILNLMEQLRAMNVVSEKREFGKGVYFLHGIAQIKGFTDEYSSGEDGPKAIRKIIEYWSNSPESEEKTLIIADLYFRLRNSVDGLAYIKKAAQILYRSGSRKKATAFYDHAIKLFAENEPTRENAEHFLDCVLDKTSIDLYTARSAEKLSLLKRAEEIAQRYRMWSYVARVKLAIGHELQFAGYPEKASQYIENFWKLSRQINDRAIFKSASLATSHFYLSMGKFSEAVRCYEEMVGNVETFGDNEETLRAGAFVGLSFAICGKVARAIGMLDTIHGKAKSLNFDSVANFADMLAVHAMLEIRNISGAEFYIERILSSPEPTLDHMVLWGTYVCKGFVLCTKGDYKGSLECHRKGWDHARAIGWKDHPGPWTFEFLAELEAHGFVNESINYDTEISHCLTSHSIYMKGAAFRYRALHDRGRQEAAGQKLADLKNSEKLLRKSGAEIELSRTLTALAGYYLKKGDSKTAQPYAQEAFSICSKIDRNLFPTSLMNIIPKEQKIELMIERMTALNKSLGKLDDIPAFLGYVIDITMSFTMATRGGFFVLGKNGEPNDIVSRNVDFSAFGREERSKEARDIVVSAARNGIEIILPEMDGERLFSRESFRKAGIRSFIFIPAKADDHIHGFLYLANRLGGQPFSGTEFSLVRHLCSQIAVIFSYISAFKEMRDLKERFESEATFYKQELGVSTPIEMIIGQSEGISKVIDRIRQVAPTDSTVLITGETGVGKELVAKAIHNLSTRKNEAFIPVNLAVLPPDLVASELFGHEKGAFTGANERHVGRFELANKGTIFLDEIGDLPLSAQVKLLRVLQEGTFERVGGVKPIQSDFRLIAATNKDLYSEVGRGTFRQDLFYRLNVFPIVVPPLRERKEDIEPLVNHFLGLFSSKMRKQIRRVPRAELSKLLSYHWPGNVRELQHLIERSLILSNGNSITFSLYDSSSDGSSANKNISMAMEDVEREHIQKVLDSTLWRIKGPNGAASILKMDPSTLRSRMKKLKIEKTGSLHSSE